MYTHLYVSTAQATNLLFALDIPESALSGKEPVKLPELEATVETSRLPELFVNQRSIQHFGDIDRAGVCVLKFPRYLPRLPHLLANLSLEVLVVEFVRLNSAPTKAQAGYYEDKLNGFFAVVERVVPAKQRSGDDPGMVYAENLRVAALTLENAQDLHTKLSKGEMDSCFLVNAFE